MDYEISLVDEQRKRSALYLMRVNSFHETCFNYKSSHILECMCWDRQGVTEQGKDEDPLEAAQTFKYNNFSRKEPEEQLSSLNKK